MKALLGLEKKQRADLHIKPFGETYRCGCFFLKMPDLHATDKTNRIAQ